LILAKVKERNPQMSQMNADEFLGTRGLKTLICGHLRHLRMISLTATDFSISLTTIY
jgi:hypothetical protein